MDDLTTREKMALRIMAAMLRLIAPHQDHAFKNDEMIDYIFGVKK